MLGLGATYNTLVSTQNQAHWGFEDDIEYTLCVKEESSIDHILAVCQKALQCGRYKFRHNAVLRVMQVMIIIGVIQRERKKV